jgi:hypothetical protein
VNSGGLLIKSCPYGRSAWTKLRLNLVCRLVKKMAADRKRLAQQPYQEWHRNEGHENGAHTAFEILFTRVSALGCVAAA